MSIMMKQVAVRNVKSLHCLMQVKLLCTLGMLLVVRTETEFLNLP
jgi:hypothetical protein